MAYKDELAARIRTALGDPAGRQIEEKVMFGGIAFMLDGHMFVGTLTPGFAGITSGGMMVRVGKDAHDAATAEPDVVPMVMAGRTMRGFAAVLPSACATVAQVKRWIARTTAFVATLPPKTAERRLTTVAKAMLPVKTAPRAAKPRTQPVPAPTAKAQTKTKTKAKAKAKTKTKTKTKAKTKTKTKATATRKPAAAKSRH